MQLTRVLSIIILSAFIIQPGYGDDQIFPREQIIKILSDAKFRNALDKNAQLNAFGSFQVADETYTAIDYIYVNQKTKHGLQRILFIKNHTQYDGSIDVDISLRPKSILNGKIVFEGDRGEAFINIDNTWPPKNIFIGGENLKYTR